MRRRGLAGLYERHVFPRINDSVAGRPEFDALRREVLARAHGRVVEIGFGSGASLALYPAAVTRVIGVEPNDGMVARAQPRLAGSPVRAHIVVAAAEHLPLPDASADTVVSVLTLCSVADPVAVLADVRRILRPNGQVLFAEHGLAADPGVARWQKRLNPVQKMLACGCHLDRPIASLVTEAGFDLDPVRSFHMPGTPRTHGWFTVGRGIEHGANRPASDLTT